MLRWYNFLQDNTEGLFVTSTYGCRCNRICHMLLHASKRVQNFRQALYTLAKLMQRVLLLYLLELWLDHPDSPREAHT